MSAAILDMLPKGRGRPGRPRAAREVKRRELLDALAQGGVAEMLKGRPFTQHPEKPD